MAIANIAHTPCGLCVSVCVCVRERELEKFSIRLPCLAVSLRLRQRSTIGRRLSIVFGGGCVHTEKDTFRTSEFGTCWEVRAWDKQWKFPHTEGLTSTLDKHMYIHMPWMLKGCLQRNYGYYLTLFDWNLIELKLCTLMKHTSISVRLQWYF